jgi:hypothetical protein
MASEHFYRLVGFLLYCVSAFATISFFVWLVGKVK